MTDTGWTIEPDLVRVGVRKVTETEAVVTGLMDVPNGQNYDLGCQSQLADVDGYWSPVTSGYVGSISMQPLTAQTDYEYRCRLQWDFDAYGMQGRRLEGKYLRTLDTDLALAEIGGSVTGNTATISVDLVNTDGSATEIHLRHRPYPTEQWNSPAPQSTTTATTEFTLTGLADNAVYEFEASLDLFFNLETTLTLYLLVGVPSITPSPSDGGTPTDDGTQDPTTVAARRTPTTAKAHLPRRPIMAVSRQTRMPTTEAVLAASSRRTTEASPAVLRPVTRRPNSGTAQVTCGRCRRTAKRV